MDNDPMNLTERVLGTRPPPDGATSIIDGRAMLRDGGQWVAVPNVSDIIRQLKALQDKQEDELLKRSDAVGDLNPEYEPWRLLGIAIGLADGYRHAADLLRGGGIGKPGKA